MPVVLNWCHVYYSVMSCYIGEDFGSSVRFLKYLEIKGISGGLHTYPWCPGWIRSARRCWRVRWSGRWTAVKQAVHRTVLVKRECESEHADSEFKADNTELNCHFYGRTWIYLYLYTCTSRGLSGAIWSAGCGVLGASVLLRAQSVFEMEGMENTPKAFIKVFCSLFNHHQTFLCRQR